MEAMDKLATVQLGRDLFDMIARAQPQARANFPRGVNVICVPTQERVHFVQKGYKLDVLYGADYKRQILGMKPSAHRGHNIQSGCRFHIDGGSANEAVSPVAASNGTGSVCYMRFTNAQIMTRNEEGTLPYIVLAHELIHSLHAVTGVIKDNDEEHWTTGIGRYQHTGMSENGFRAAFGIPRREAY